MTRGTTSRRVAVLVATLGLATAAASSAHAQDARRAVVRVASSRDRALLERLRGQSSDLGWELVPTRAPVAASLLADQLRTARAEATRADAAVVVWFGAYTDATGAAAILVHVFSPASGRLLVRTVTADTAAASASQRETSALESAALIVRGALRALSRGAVLGLQPTTAPDDRAPPAEAPPAPAPPAIVVVPPPPSAPWRPHAQLGWHAAIDGQSPTGQQGPAASLGVTYRALDLSLQITAGLPVELRDEFASVQLSRYTLGLFAGFSTRVGATLGVSVGVLAGAAAWVRATSALRPEVLPTASRWVPSVVVAPELQVRYSPQFAGGRLAITLALAADIVPSAPILGYQIGESFQPAWALWVIQPRATLGFVVGPW